MASNRKAVAVVVGAGGLAALALLTGKAKAEPKQETKVKPRPLTEKQQAAALAMKYARAFGIPPSLLLALIAVGGWRGKGHVANTRGGAWGYTFMTLATAQDLTKRFPAVAAKYWPKFAKSQSAAALLDSAENIALGAYQLSLQWKRFKDWYTAALSYYTGAGAMDKLVKQGGGKLPATLPANVAKQKAAYTRVRTADAYVKKALATPGVGSLVGAPVFTTSEDAKQKWNTLNAATTNLDGDIARWFKAPGKRNADETAYVNAWLRWRDAVYSEYKDNARTKIIPDLAWSVWNRGDEKLRELADWRTRFEAISGKKASAPVTVPEEAGKPKTDYGPLIKGGIIVAGIGAAAALVASVKH
jgi:Transglycosylase SLT domain